MAPLLIHIIANLSPITNLQQVALLRKNGIIVHHAMVQAIVNIAADQAKMHIREMGVAEFVVVQANVPVAMAKEVGKYKKLMNYGL